MVYATKERIIAAKHFAAGRYIRSLHPVLYISGRRDSQGTNKFLSDDAYGHLCTVTGTLWTSQGRDLDGTDDKITLGASAILDALDSTSAITGEFWAKVDVASDSCLVNKHDVATATKGFAFAIISGNMNMYVDGVARSAGAPGAVSTGVYHHLGYTWDGGGDDKVRFYLDSVLVATSTALATLTTHTDPAILGGVTGGFAYYNGIIGEACIYNRALSLVEIQNNYQVTRWRYQ